MRLAGVGKGQRIKRERPGQDMLGLMAKVVGSRGVIVHEFVSDAFQD